MYITGIKADRVRTVAEGPEYALGTLAAEITASGPKIYRYITAPTALTLAHTVRISPTAFSAVAIDTTASAPGAGQGSEVGVVIAAIGAGEYGWVQVFGVCNIRVAANCAAFTMLNTVASAGLLDDDATAGSEVIDGLIITTAAGGSTSTVAGVVNWPKIGRTL